MRRARGPSPPPLILSSPLQCEHAHMVLGVEPLCLRTLISVASFCFFLRDSSLLAADSSVTSWAWSRALNLGFFSFCAHTYTCMCKCERGENMSISVTHTHTYTHTQISTRALLSKAPFYPPSSCP
jgi:hypothetical protein